MQLINLKINNIFINKVPVKILIDPHIEEVKKIK